MDGSASSSKGTACSVDPTRYRHCRLQHGPPPFNCPKGQRGGDGACCRKLSRRIQFPLQVIPLIHAIDCGIAPSSAQILTSATWLTRHARARGE